jgi:hypothetical protein
MLSSLNSKKGGKVVPDAGAADGSGTAPKQPPASLEGSLEKYMALLENHDKAIGSVESDEIQRTEVFPWSLYENIEGRRGRASCCC